MIIIYFLDQIVVNNVTYYEITDEAMHNVVPKQYYISVNGEIYNKNTETFMPIYHNDGRYYFTYLATIHQSRRAVFIHRLLMITFNYIPQYAFMQVNHIDGNKANNSLSNMEWVTLQGNNEHAQINNLICTGDDCPWSKLTEADVHEICQIIASKNYTTLGEIAAKYNCSLCTIGDIVRGRSWKDISSQYDLDYDVRHNFSDQEVHQICRIFSQNKGQPFDFLYYMVLLFMGYPDETRIRRRIRKLYSRNKRAFYDITSQYDY